MSFTRTSRPRAWFLSVALVALGSCRGDEPAPNDDPFDDPWVDAIDTGEEQAPAVAAVTPDPAAAAEGGAVAIAEPDSPAAAAVVPATAVDGSAQASPGGSAQASLGGSAQASPGGSAQASLGGSAQASPAPTSETTSAPTSAVAESPDSPTPSVEPTPASEPAAAPIPPPLTSADFHGNYRYAGGQAQRDGVADAIETTVSALSSVLHNIARKRLTEVNPVEGTVDIVVAGDKVTTTFESGFTVTARIEGGTASAKAIDGSKLEVRLHAKDNKLVQQMVGKGGGRTIVYVLSADRQKLTVHHKITSKRLPVPLTYRLSYARN